MTKAGWETPRGRGPFGSTLRGSSRSFSQAMGSGAWRSGTVRSVGLPGEHEDPLGKAGRWRGFIDLGYVGGKRVRKYVTGRTRAEVAAALRKVADSRDAGTLQLAPAGTVAQWLTFWVETIAAAKVRPSTLATYRGYITNRLIPELGRHRLDRLQPEHPHLGCQSRGGGEPRPPDEPSDLRRCGAPPGT